MVVAPIEQRFNAAVNVIRGLPKHGSYQPSNDMLLRFYAYFKQATLGPCKQQRPAFWNVVDKAKWDSYHALGNMPSDRAMELYVEELKKIIETMSYTDNVAEFMGSVGELGDVDIGDLEAVAPEAIKQVRSRPNSPFASRESSPVRSLDQMAAAAAASFVSNGGGGGLVSQAVHDAVDQLLVGANGDGGEAEAYMNGHGNGGGIVSDQSDDEYIDTVEDDTILHADSISHRYSRSNSRRMDNYIDQHLSNGHIQHNHHHSPHRFIDIPSQHQHFQHSNTANNGLQTNPSSGGSGNGSGGGPQSNANGTGSTTTTMHVVSANVEPAMNQMLRCVEAMRVDLQQINNRINIVERSLGDVRQQQQSANARGGAAAGKQTGSAAASSTSSTVALVGRYAPAWWPFAGITPAWFVVMAVVWPLVARRLVRMVQGGGGRRR